MQTIFLLAGTVPMCTCFAAENFWLGSWGRALRHANEPAEMFLCRARVRNKVSTLPHDYFSPGIDPLPTRRQRAQSNSENGCVPHDSGVFPEDATQRRCSTMTVIGSSIRRQ